MEGINLWWRAAMDVCHNAGLGHPCTSGLSNEQLSEMIARSAAEGEETRAAMEEARTRAVKDGS